MEKILKRVQDYTPEEFKEYCTQHGLDWNLYKSEFRQWAIESHEYDLSTCLHKLGSRRPVQVSGVVGISGSNYQIKPKQFSLADGVNATLTADVQDYSILRGSRSAIYVSTTHALGHNLFRIKFLDD